MDDYCSQVPVQHVVFMVHGIGQRLEKSNLVDDVSSFRHITTSLSEQHLTSYQRGVQRVSFYPMPGKLNTTAIANSWRKGLKLSGEAAVEKITLDGVRGLRVMLSATVHDVLYYMSPIYRQDIINAVSNQLNRLYLKFLKRNPGYDGKVSIYGHSLGSVLSYDILCHQENLTSPFPMDWMYKEYSRSEESSLDTKRGTSTNLEDNISNVVKEAKKIVDPVEEKMMSARSTLVHENGLSDDFSTILSPIASELVGAASDSNFKQIHGKENPHEFVCDSSDVLSQERDHLCEAKDMKLDDPMSGVENRAVEGSENAGNKEKEINMLMKEIDSLKAKIAELEFKCGGGDASENGKATESMTKQPISKKLAVGLDEAPKSYTPYIKYTKLEFKVDTFYAVGSPLGVFLSLHNVRIGLGKGKEYWAEENISEEMPACRQMLNIFHPFDPVAYRIEPLVCKEFISKRPVIIPYHKGGRRLHIGFQEFTEDLAARSQAIINHLNVVKVKVLTVCQSKIANSEEEAENVNEKEERTYGSIMMERLTGSEGRIDHMLQRLGEISLTQLYSAVGTWIWGTRFVLVSVCGMASSEIVMKQMPKNFAVTWIKHLNIHICKPLEHTRCFISPRRFLEGSCMAFACSSRVNSNYWRDHDTALFILKHLYREIPEEPKLPAESSGGTSKDEIGSTGWYDQSETNEELPLTFSDRMMAKNFSKKANKYMKSPKC
ncbi:phospholipase SGR2-like isoform X4 [Populus alba x Populus x berolinensis]|uniref:Phospholipase SGR2-like isoform X4 n=1 Tax=Populus alba x Populus x berolinensis TaxID=444605 RepID=A0AAD6PQ09_9ROSI|nr:phospholipase SGR2-like isoform X4 [Populus alba x Populus x berolinensis]